MCIRDRYIYFSFARRVAPVGAGPPSFAGRGLAAPWWAAYELGKTLILTLFYDVGRDEPSKVISSKMNHQYRWYQSCLLYTSDAADERSSVDLGGRRIIKKKKK